METNDFEKAFSDFIDRREYDEAQNALLGMVCTSFNAGWQATGGDPPIPHQSSTNLGIGLVRRGYKVLIADRHDAAIRYCRAGEKEPTLLRLRLRKVGLGAFPDNLIFPFVVLLLPLFYIICPLSLVLTPEIDYKMVTALLFLLLSLNIIRYSLFAIENVVD